MVYSLLQPDLVVSEVIKKIVENSTIINKTNNLGILHYT